MSHLLEDLRPAQKAPLRKLIAAFLGAFLTKDKPFAFSMKYLFHT